MLKGCILHRAHKKCIQYMNGYRDYNFFGIMLFLILLTTDEILCLRTQRVFSCNPLLLIETFEFYY